MTRARWFDTVAVLSLVACVFAAFAPALQGEFLQWDDDRNFLGNPFYRGLGAEQIRWMFTTFHMGPYQPLSWITLGFDHVTSGMDPAGYHRTSLVIHALASVTFFAAARRLFEATSAFASPRTRTVCAFLAAFAFGVHPLRAESVAWVTERRDVVSGFFFAATTYAWIAAVGGERRRAGWYATALVAFVAALASKATVVGLPVALFVMDVWPLRRWARDRRRVVLDLVPFVVLSIVFAVVAVRGQASTGTALRGFEDYGVVQRLAQTVYSCVFYPWKTLVPTGLSPIYDVPSPFDPFAARFVIAAIVFVVACGLAWTSRQRAPAWTAAWIAFLALVAPVSGIVSTGPQLVADRYSYLACMPFALAGAVGLGRLLESRATHVFTAAAVLILGAASLVATRAQTRHWLTNESLWERAYDVDPDSPVACQQLGVVRMNQAQVPGASVAERARRYEEALALYTRAYETAPHPNHVFNIAGLVMQRAELDPATRAEQLGVAIETFQNGMEFASRTTGVLPRWRVMYASALVEAGRRAEARAELDAALAAEPSNVGAILWLARVEQEEGHVDAAVARLEAATRFAPEHPTAWRALHALQAKSGRTADAAATRERAARAGVAIDVAPITPPGAAIDTSVPAK